MKTKQEIQQEISELLGAIAALGEVMDHMHEKRMVATRKLFALHQMIKDMETDDDKN